MGAPFLEPPGRASHTYRSDEMAFATAKVPDRALAAKRFVETHYRGADFLGARGGGTRWDASTALGPAPLRGMRRDEARAKCLSTTRDGLAFPRHTPRPFGFGGDPLGATAPIAAARRASVLRASSDSDAARDASRRETARVGARERDSGITKGALGVGHRSIAFEKPFAASSRTPGEWRASASRVGDDSEPFGEALRVAFPGGAREASDDPRVEGERRVAEPETAGGRDPGDEKKRREKSRLARRRRPRRVRSARAKVTRKATRREATRVLFP